MHDVDGSALIGDGPLLGLVVEFPMQRTPAYCSLHVDRTSCLVFLFVLSNHQSSVLEPNLVSQNMTNNNFARGLGLNDDDDEMNQLYNAAHTGTGMKSTIVQFWKKRRAKLTHDYSLVRYILSPNPTIMEHAVNNKGQIHDDAAEWLITKLLLNPAFVGSNKAIERAKLIDTFM